MWARVIMGGKMITSGGAVNIEGVANNPETAFGS